MYAAWYLNTRARIQLTLYFCSVKINAVWHISPVKLTVPRRRAKYILMRSVRVRSQNLHKNVKAQRLAILLGMHHNGARWGGIVFYCIVLLVSIVCGCLQTRERIVRLYIWRYVNSTLFHSRDSTEIFWQINKKLEERKNTSRTGKN